MKISAMRYIYLFLMLTVLIYLGTSSYAQNIFPDIVENGAMPKVFLQEGVMVPNKQSGPTFSSNGKTVYLADNDTIKVSVLKGGKWIKPVTLSFSGRWHDWDPALSPNGKTMVFVSDRPLPGMAQDKPQKSAQLWITELISGTEWSAPKHLDPPVNPVDISSYGPSIGKNRTLYFSSIGRDGTRSAHAYYSQWLGDHYDTPVQLNLNGDQDVLDPFVAPDERYIIFKSGFDLYVCYRQGLQWSVAYKLGAQVNNGGYNTVPKVSPDGKTLYYSSSGTKGILMIPINIPKK
jgi:Tol biopolymer transport system component